MFLLESLIKFQFTLISQNNIALLKLLNENLVRRIRLYKTPFEEIFIILRIWLRLWLRDHEMWLDERRNSQLSLLLLPV